jgi:hypothetical protein
MKYPVQLTPDDLVAAHRLSLRPRAGFRGACYVLLGLVVVAAAISSTAIIRREAPLNSLTVPLLLVAYVAIIVFVIMPWRARKIFRQQKGLQRPYTVTLESDEFVVEAHNGHMRLKWSDVHKWKYNHRLILLYHSDAIYSMIPCRVFSGPTERDEALGFLRQRLGNPVS